MSIVFEDDKGFVMDFEQAGPVLKYTLRPADAQEFDTIGQVMHFVRTNNLTVDTISIMPYNKT